MFFTEEKKMKKFWTLLIIVGFFFSFLSVPTALFAGDAADDLNDAYTGQSDYFAGNPSESHPVPGVPDVGPSGPVE